MRTDNARLTERAAAADRRAVQSDGEAQAAQQKTMQSAQEQMALQTALDKAHAELSQVTRRLTETDKTLKAAQARLATAETSLADAQAERLRLSAALDEAGHRHSDSTTAMSAKFEALQARATMTEKLLEEARTALIARADEIRTFERRVHDTASAHSNADERVAELTATLAEREAQIRDLEHAHATASQHNEMLAGHVDTHKTSSENALEKISEQADLLQLLESQLKTMREAHALQIEQLNAQLRREQLERTMAEGALAAGRKDIAQMLRQIQALQQRPNPMAAQAEMPAASARVRSAA
jgi:chromosome segregation ATPase